MSSSVICKYMWSVCDQRKCALIHGVMDTWRAPDIWILYFLYVSCVIDSTGNLYFRNNINVHDGSCFQDTVVVNLALFQKGFYKCKNDIFRLNVANDCGLHAVAMLRNCFDPEKCNWGFSSVRCCPESSPISSGLFTSTQSLNPIDRASGTWSTF